MSDKKLGRIDIEDVEEHDDGSATFTVQLDDDVREHLASEGLKLVLYCAAAQMDIQKVYDFIEENMNLTEYK